MVIKGAWAIGKMIDNALGCAATILCFGYNVSVEQSKAGEGVLTTYSVAVRRDCWKHVRKDRIMPKEKWLSSSKTLNHSGSYSPKLASMRETNY